MQFLNAFDRAMNLLDEKFKFLASSKQIVSSTDEADKVKVLTTTKRDSDLMHTIPVF